MHVYDALWRPNPIVFFGIGDFAILTAHNFVLPFDAREVHPPFIAIIRWRRLVRVFGQRFPGHRNFDCPAFVFVVRIIQRAFDVNGSLQSNDVPAIVGCAKLKDQPGRKVIWIIWAGGGGNPFKIADLDLKRFGIEIATGGNILPAMAAYKNFPGMEGATYYYFGIPKNPVNEWLVANHYVKFKSPPDFFTAGGMSAAIALVEALKKTAGDTNTEKLIKTMEGMSFETPKGKMTLRKEDHQAMQSMYHFKIKDDPAFAWGVPELVREIRAEDMNIPIRNTR